MGLRDIMKSDLPAIMADLRETVVVTPMLPEGETDATFEISGVFGDQSQGFTENAIGIKEAISAPFVCQRSTWRTAMGAAGFIVRDPVRGDKFTVSEGEYAGEWYVQLCGADQGDALTLTLVNPTLFKLGDAAAMPIT